MVGVSMVVRARRRLRPVALFFTRSSHRDLLTKNLRQEIERFQGPVIDIGGGRNSPLAVHWPVTATRIRLDISIRFEPMVQGDAHALPIRDGAFDGAVLSEVLEHLREPAVAIAEIRRVLRPGASLVGSVPFAIGIHADPHDYYRYTHESLAWLLRDFEDVSVTPHGNHFGAAWRAINERWHLLWFLNPFMRLLSRRTDPRWPVGYTFVARKPLDLASDE